MKQTKRIVSIVLVLALLCAVPIVSRAGEEAFSEANTTEYPAIFLGGGWHKLMYAEPGREGEVAFDAPEQENVAGLLSALLDEVLPALQALDPDKFLNSVKDILWDMLGPVRMDENGESVFAITDDGSSYQDENIYSDTIWCHLDWRLDPMDNAEKLQEFIDYCKEKRRVDKFHLKGMSSSGTILMAYLEIYGTDDVASAVFDVSMHNGTTLFGELAKRQLHIDTEAFGKLNIPNIASTSLPDLQPALRILYESGLLDFVLKLLFGVANLDLGRVHDEILIPLFFMMPIFWSYVPAKDFEAAKEALLQGNPKYAKLVEKIDRYHNEVGSRTDEILLETAKKVKLGIHASYGLPLIPLVKGAAVQADFMVDTVYASSGATCAPLGSAFGPFYRQQKKDGHNHISPDRVIDASTCVLPDQTWFASNKLHWLEGSYSGWYDWFINTENPTVFSDKRYPQFVKELEPTVFVPMEAEPGLLIKNVLRSIGLELLRIWRWLLLLPLFWMD